MIRQICRLLRVVDRLKRRDEIAKIEREARERREPRQVRDYDGRLHIVGWRPAKRDRPRCGARTKTTGKPCQAPAVHGKGKCRLHGGASTGPRTDAGKARIAEAQRQRWARWRIEQAPAA